MKRDDLFAGYEQGQRDMLATVFAELERMIEEWPAWSSLSDALAALRALQEKPTPPPLPPSVGIPEKHWFR